MRLKTHEFELLCSIALKTREYGFKDYETEFLFDLTNRAKLNKKK